MQDANAEQGIVQLIVDQLEELVVTLFEEIRERPAVAAAIVAAIVGAVIGSVLAAGAARQHTPPQRVVKRARGMAEAADLAGLGVKLLQNPLVRGYVMSAFEKQLKKRFSN